MKKLQKMIPQDVFETLSNMSSKRVSRARSSMSVNKQEKSSNELDSRSSIASKRNNLFAKFGNEGVNKQINHHQTSKFNSRHQDHKISRFKQFKDEDSIFMSENSIDNPVSPAKRIKQEKLKILESQSKKFRICFRHKNFKVRNKKDSIMGKIKELKSRISTIQRNSRNRVRSRYFSENANQTKLNMISPHRKSKSPKKSAFSRFVSPLKLAKPINKVSFLSEKKKFKDKNLLFLSTDTRIRRYRQKLKPIGL